MQERASRPATGFRFGQLLTNDIGIPFHAINMIIKIYDIVKDYFGYNKKTWYNSCESKKTLDIGNKKVYRVFMNPNEIRAELLRRGITVSSLARMVKTSRQNVSMAIISRKGRWGKQKKIIEKIEELISKKIGD